MAAELLDEHTVRLTFSEPVASVDDVNPADFRISVAQYYPYPGYDAYTYYADPIWFLCGRTDACLGDYTDVTELGCDPDDPASILLHLDSFSAFLCPLIEWGKDYAPVLDLFPHYRPGSIPIRDLDGEDLAPIGPAWVDGPPYAMMVDGMFTGLDPMVPIPCTLDPG